MDNNALSQQPYLTFFDEGTAEYDVIVDQSSSAPNLKEATWGALQPLLPLVADRLGPEEFALILEYSPLPESFIEKFQGIADQKAQQPPPPDPEVMKIEAMKQAKAAELQMKQQEVSLDMQLEERRAASEIELERQKAAAQIQLEREKLQANIKLSRMEMRHKAAVERGDPQGSDAGEVEVKGSETMDEQDMDLFGNRALSDAMTQMAQAITAMAQGVSDLGTRIEQSLSKPKRIVRGPDGRAVGVQ